MKQKYVYNFKGQNLYIGIDVHLNSWTYTIITESGFQETRCGNASAKELYKYLCNHYEGANYLATYESGFSGFSTYYALEELGIRCLVTHAADVPTTQGEKVKKTDKVDSVKLAKSLKSGLLTSVYVHKKDNLDARAIVRLRSTFVKELSRYKSRVKHQLYNNGVQYPETFQKSGTHWSQRFMSWLKKDVVLISSTRDSLDFLLEKVDIAHKDLLRITRKVRELSRSERYTVDFENLRSIHGIGLITAMTILTEIDNINRFRNEKEFASYLGLIPISHSSGEKQCDGEKTFRGNKQIGPMLIESSWTIIRYDRAMALAYGEFCQRMESQKAIVKIARKLSNRIFFVLKNKTTYQYDKRN